jgi:hypothetical protein
MWGIVLVYRHLAGEKDLVMANNGSRLQRSPVITADEAHNLRAYGKKSHRNAMELNDELTTALRIMSVWTLGIYNQLYAENPEKVPSPPLLHDRTLHNMANTGRLWLAGRERFQRNVATRMDSDPGRRAWQILREVGDYA